MTNRDAETRAEATAGPWIASDENPTGNWRVETDAPGWPNDGWIIATFEGPDAEANAKLVASLVNRSRRTTFTKGRSS